MPSEYRSWRSSRSGLVQPRRLPFLLHALQRLPAPPGTFCRRGHVSPAYEAVPVPVPVTGMALSHASTIAPSSRCCRF